MLVATMLSLLVMPLLNAYSRFNERQADRYAFRSIPAVEPFISAMDKLAAQNLAERSPCSLGGMVFPFASGDFAAGGGGPRLGESSAGNLQVSRIDVGASVPLVPGQMPPNFQQGIERLWRI